MFRLETGRLIIRPWETADRTVLESITGDPEVMRFIGGGQPFTSKDN